MMHSGHLLLLLLFYVAFSDILCGVCQRVWSRRLEPNTSVFTHFTGMVYGQHSLRAGHCTASR